MRSMASFILTERHFKAIGLVVAEWSWVESFVEYLIWELAEINQTKGCAITTHIPSETRINILSTLADIGMSDAALKKELNVTMDRIRQLRGERNNIVHALWQSSKPPRGLLDLIGREKRRKPVPARLKITAKGKLVLTTKNLTAKQILAVADEIVKLVNDMSALLHRIRLLRSPAGKALSIL